MNENLKAFLEKVSKDEALQAKFQNVHSPDEAYALASSVQEGFTKEEFVETMTKLYQMEKGELSDEDLEAVSGGVDIGGVDIPVTDMLIGAGIVTGGFVIAGAAAV